MEVWCNDLAALLDAERCERAAIAGHCLGASITLHFAARYPARAAAIVLIEPMPPEALTGTTRWLRFLEPLLYVIYAAARSLNALGIYRRKLEELDLREWDRATRTGEVKLSMFASLGIDLKSTPIAAYARMLAALPECDIVEIDAVHWIPTEQPEAMRTTIEDWLGRKFTASP